METKPWLNSYPQGVPHEVDVSQYTSLVDLLEESFRKNARSPVSVCMEEWMTYAQLDENEGRQNSWTLGLNYNIAPTVVLKTEYKRVDTSGGYDGVFVRGKQELYENELFERSGGLAGVPARNYDGDIISVGVDFVF